MAGFISKVFIFTAAWGNGQALINSGKGMIGQWLIVLVVAALINSIISLVYYGRIVKAMYFDAPLKEDHLSTPFGLSSSIVLMTAALIVITFAAQVVLAATGPAANSLLGIFIWEMNSRKKQRQDDPSILPLLFRLTYYSLSSSPASTSALSKRSFNCISHGIFINIVIRFKKFHQWSNMF